MGRTWDARSSVNAAITKGAKRQGAGVQHHGPGGVRHPVPEVPPAVAQLPALRGEAEPRRVEAADLAEKVGRHGQVVGREEAGGVRVAVVEVVDEVHDQLAGRGVGVARQAVDRAAADHAPRRRPEVPGQGGEPVRRRPAVVVGEGQEPPARRRGARVARGARPGVGLAQQGEAQLAEVRPDGRALRLWAAVIHHDHLEPPGRNLKAGQRRQAVRQRPRPGVGWNNHGERAGERTRGATCRHCEGGPVSRKKVFVSGCFDLLHSGHVAFLQAAAAHGDLYVALGSDATIRGLKGRPPVCTAAERLYVVRALACVTEAFISPGSGMLDFAGDLRRLRPDLFVVGADGHAPQKERLCRELGVEYLVLDREPAPGLPARSTTSLRQIDLLPYRADLAGGWLDQPLVSRLHPGPVVTVSIEPTVTFNERSGMATSTRNRARELWGARLPPGEPEQLARVLFAYDNPPGTVRVAGSQDAIGIAVPGLACSYYQGDYWPERIERLGEES